MSVLEEIGHALKAAKVAKNPVVVKSSRSRRERIVRTSKLKIAKAKAGEEAVEILKAAGILTKSGKLSRRYR